MYCIRYLSSENNLFDIDLYLLIQTIKKLQFLEIAARFCYYLKINNEQ